MQGNLSIKGIPILSIYSQYIEGKYIINRRYQRKLVWSVEEKKKFIDSLLNEFPIPLIIAANYVKSDNEKAFEILDGMQRLNAITSFIEGEFSINSMYFNLEAVAQTKIKLASGDLQQKIPILEIEKCSKLLDYPVPFSVCDDNKSEKVDESFRRINTRGRVLSKQDVRQAGALGTIPDLIRDASIYVRKDGSHSNILDLQDIKNISLSGPDLDYGVDLKKIFWARHGIITYENIRKSRDEELVAHIVSYIAKSDNSQTTSKYLDAIYDCNKKESLELTQAINKIGSEEVYRRFCFVFDEIEKTLDSDNTIFKELVFENNPVKVTNVYQVVYIAFYKALMIQNLEVNDYEELCRSLRNIFDRHLKKLESKDKWNANDRESLSNAILGVMKDHFRDKPESNSSFGSWRKNLENILNESKTEQVCYDFKLGLHKIADGTGSFSETTFNKIVKTLVAMTNSKAGDCYVIIGVADKETDANCHKSHYGSEYIKYRNFCITGIDDEANKYCGSIQKYEEKILQLVEKEPISTNFKHIIKSKMVTFSYGEKEILLFKACRSNQPELYDNEIFIRNLSHTEKVEQDTMFNFYDRFKKESDLMQKAY